MGWFKKAGGWLGRGAAAVATGGASEAYRAATGKADPYSAYQERLGSSLGGKVDDATGQGDSMKNPYDGPETDEEKRIRLGQQADLDRARAYRDRLSGETADPRVAPQVGAPKPVQAARVAGAAPIGASAPIGFERVDSTFDPSGQADTQAMQRAYLERTGQIAAGTAGPSAAELQMRAGNASAIRQAAALAGGNKGYSGSALRNAQRVGASLAQQNVQQTGILRADEQARARAEYGQAVAAARGQDIGLATTEADLALRAGVANQGAGLTAGVETARNQIEIAKANQNTELQRNLTQAGLDQEAIMHMSDQQLQVALANAGFKLTQQQIDDLRAHNLRQAQLEAQGQVLSGGASQAQQAARIKELRAQYAMAIQANDQKRADAALAMLADLGAAYATGGTSLAVKPPGGGYDSDAALPLGYTGG